MKVRLSLILLLLLPVTCFAAAQVVILKGGYFSPTSQGAEIQPEGPPTALRGKSESLFYAEAGAPVKLKLTCFQVGHYSDDLQFSIVSSSGASLAQGKVAPTQSAETPFTPPQSGVYRLVCDAGQNAAEVQATNARLCMPAGGGRNLAVVDHARKMWFYCPEGSQGFKVRIWGQGKEETVAVKIWSPDEKEVATGTTVGSNEGVAEVNVTVPTGMDNSLWSLQLVKAAQGIFEDAQLELTGGVAPYVAEKPNDLLIPIMRVQVPAIYRRTSSGPLTMECSLLAPTHLLRKPTTFVHMIDPKTGDSLYSEMIFRFGEGEYKIRLPQDKVWRGSFLAKITQREGEEIIHTFEQMVYVVNRPQNLNQDNVTLVDGKPFFARGLYHVQPKDYDLVKKQGFNIVQAGPGQIADCERAGLKAAVMLYGGMKIDPAYYREMITKYKNSPAVACWMIMDEPCGNRVPVQKTEEAYGLIRDLDPAHPAYMCVCPCRPTVYQEYGRSTDIIAIDVYPVDRQPLTDISKWLDVAKKDAPDQAVWFIGQVWSWPGKEDKAKRTLVTPAQHRCMTYLSLTHDNCRGLMWYSFRDPDWFLPDNNPELWAACKKVNEELASLEPVLHETNKWERVVKPAEGAGAAPQGEIHLCLKPHEGKLYLIAVNPTDKPVPLSLDLAEDQPGAEAKVLFEDRTVKLTGTTLSDQFAPLAVHIYEIAKP